MTKLVLVYPNQRWLKEDNVTTWDLDPRTLCGLASMVNDIVDVEIIDCQINNYSVEDFTKKINQSQANYVGISLLTSEYAEIMDIAANAVKAADPSIVVIAGGVHVTTQPHQVMENLNIDYGCHGEGEYLLKDLMMHLVKGSPLPTTGLIYRDEQHVIVQPRSVVDNISELPWPDYDLVDYQAYLNSVPRHGANRFPQLPGMYLIVSRGCPVGCSFCQVEMISGKKIRMRDPEDILDEIEFLKKRYGLKSIVFLDDNLFLMRKRAKRLLEGMISRKLNISWQAAAFAIFAMDDEMIDLMRDAGCKSVNCAIESGSQRVLEEIIQKPIKDLKEIPKLINKIKDRGINVLANFIIGLPGETWSEIRETIHFAEHCNADYVKFFIAVPLVGTKLTDMAINMNVLDMAENELKVDWRNSQITSNEWTSQDISALRVNEWDRINFQPERIAKVAEIWGLTIEEMELVRKNTREALYKTRAGEPECRDALDQTAGGSKPITGAENKIFPNVAAE